VKESVDLFTLEKSVRESIGSEQEDTTSDAGNKKVGETTVDLYTIVQLQDDGMYHVWQEANGKEIPDTRGTYNEENNPWLALRFSRIDGEDYGRGYVEEYIGDLNSLEYLTEAIVQGSLASAKVIFMVNPNGTTDVNELNKANNGDFVSGIPDEVQAL